MKNFFKWLKSTGYKQYWYYWLAFLFIGGLLTTGTEFDLITILCIIFLYGGGIALTIAHMIKSYNNRNK